MALIKVKDLLKHAEENGYGVPAINVFDYNSIKFAVMAAEEAHMPLIIQYYPGFKEHAPLRDIRDMAVAWLSALLFLSLFIWITPKILILQSKV